MIVLRFLEFATDKCLLKLKFPLTFLINETLSKQNYIKDNVLRKKYTPI